MIHSFSIHKRGFTIVELLIVIVVIGALAAISVAAYNGIQQRSQNSARIAAARQIMNVLGMYSTTSSVDSLLDSIPVLDGACLGTEYPDINGDGRGDCRYSGDEVYSSNISEVDNALATTDSYQNIDFPMLEIDGGYIGLEASHYPSTVDGRAVRFQIRYYLKGENQDCAIKTLWPTVDPDPVTGLGAGYTLMEDNINSASIPGLTACVVGMHQFE